jgi:hypothetical protein
MGVNLLMALWVVLIGVQINRLVSGLLRRSAASF